MTLGAIVVEAIRAHLKHSGKKFRQLTAVDIEGIVDKADATRGKPKIRGPRPRATELDEIWIQELEQDPTFAGIDIRRQLGMAQVWARENRRVCSRKFFVNVLWKRVSEIGIRVNGEGQSSKDKRPPDVYTEPATWRKDILSLPYDKDRLKELAAGKWLDVPINIREILVR